MAKPLYQAESRRSKSLLSSIAVFRIFGYGGGINDLGEAMAAELQPARSAGKSDLIATVCGVPASPGTTRSA